ncbi:MAG: trehalose-phosphatase [Acidobacteriaceae bacterium]|nr:trehalose-phosphatase [Acidobacteriaceae bacterium]MBV9780390.1 trehalose-phosphatase [Acidobacteriaceae bacterium]
MSAVARVHHPVPLLKNLQYIEPRVAEAPRISLFLDFDGTLSPIVLNPAEACLEPTICPILKRLRDRLDFDLAVISGRALVDVRERIGLNKVIYAGNHGLEIEFESMRFREPRAESLRRELRCVLLQLKLALSETEGLEIEDKSLTLSVHFRRVSEHLHDWVRSVVYSAVGRSKSFTCGEGKMVLEVRPQVTWNKGHAIKWIAREVLPAGSLPVFIGDDVSDEDGFAAIPDGITIRVGEPTETQAQFLLPDVPAVGQFLEWLDHAKPNATLANSQRAGR